MSELEAKAERLLYDQVKSMGGHTIKVAPLVLGNPDRLVLLHGTHLLEMKRPGKDAEVHQRAMHLKARKAGVVVHTVVGTAGVHSWLRALVCAHNATEHHCATSCTCPSDDPHVTFFRTQRFWDGTEVHPRTEAR